MLKKVMDAMIVKKFHQDRGTPRASYCVHKRLHQSIFWASWITSTSSNYFYL